MDSASCSRRVDRPGAAILKQLGVQRLLNPRLYNKGSSHYPGHVRALLHCRCILRMGWSP